MRRVPRLLLSLAFALVASAASAKDSVTIGMTLEPPGLDPTTAPAAAIGEIVHYNIFEGLTKINEDFSVTPLLAESWAFSPDLKTLTFKLKPGVKFQDGEPFTSKDVKYSFERYGGKDSTNKDKAFFASIESIGRHDPLKVVLSFKAAELLGAVSSGLNTAVIIDEKSAAERRRRTRSAPDLTSSANWNKGASVTLDKWDGYPRRRQDRASNMRPSASSPIPRPRSRRCWRATSTPSRASQNDPGARPVQGQPAVPGR